MARCSYKPAEKSEKTSSIGWRGKQGKRQGRVNQRVGLYARVSIHNQQTLDLQPSAMRELADHRGWVVVLTVEDVGSGVRELPGARI